MSIILGAIHFTATSLLASHARAAMAANTLPEADLRKMLVENGWTYSPVGSLTQLAKVFSPLAGAVIIQLLAIYGA